MQRALTILFIAATVAANAQIFCNFNITPENCSEANGTVQAGVGGGTAPYTYSWTPAPAMGQGTSDISGLPAGSYDLTVTDALSLQQTFTAVVWNDPTIGPAGPGTLAGAEPAVGLGVPCSGQCNGAMAFPASMFGGTPPYSLDWGPPAAYTTQGDPVYIGFCGGQSYNYTVTDAFGCFSVGSTGAIPELDTAWYWNVDSITPASCGNDDAIVHLSQSGTWPADIVVMSQSGSVVLTTNTSLGPAITGLEAGVYDVLFQYQASGCESSISVTVPEEGPGCGSVAGMLFLDGDGDCSIGAGEPGIGYRLLQADPGAQLMITNSDGAYAGGLADGAYTLTVLDPTVSATCPTSPPIAFNVSGGLASLNVGATSAAPLDLAVSAVNSAARPGFVHTVWVHLTNTGAQTSGSVELTCLLDIDMSFSNAVPAPTTALGNLLTWNLPPLGPFTDTTIRVNAQVSVSAVIGDQVEVSISVVNAGPESDLLDNTFTASRIITGALDPNDKTAFTSSGQSLSEYLIPQDEWIDYVIRFQNTGTDTAFTVVITDTLSAELDMTSYVQGAASHPFTVAFKPGRVVEWRFENLLLPDSTTNEALSHGAVGFRIRPVQPVIAGTVYENAADIYFDFNAPVHTNTSMLVASLGTGLDAPTTASIEVFPNPAHDRLVVVARRQMLHDVVLTTVDGRVVLQRTASSERIDVPVDRLAPGSYVLRTTLADGTLLNERVAIR